LLAGAAISVAGLVLQTLFNNPLAGPELLGVNSGAGLGVAVVMLMSQSTAVASAAGLGGYVTILAGAFIGSLLVISVILLLSSMLHSKLYLLVAGVAISYLVSSAISVLNYFATSEGVHSFVVWGMGSLGSVSMEYMPFFSITIAVLLVLALLMAKPLNALLLGDAYAMNLGIGVMRSRILLLAVTGMLTAVVTAFCGPIPFIGLAVPHIARLLLGTDNHRLLLPFSILLGGVMLLLCNIICQLPGESGLMPLGAITPLLGAPVIIYVILKEKRN
jgi:iron complex transport system permease protein